MTARSTASAGLALIVLVQGGCGGKENVGLLTLTSDLRTVLHVDVALRTHDGAHEDRFTRPLVEGSPLIFPKTFSLTFPLEVTGHLDVHVDARRGADLLAVGEGFGPIVRGGLTQVTIALETVTAGRGDGGTGAVDAAGGDGP